MREPARLIAKLSLTNGNAITGIISIILGTKPKDAEARYPLRRAASNFTLRL